MRLLCSSKIQTLSKYITRRKNPKGVSRRDCLFWQSMDCAYMEGRSGISGEHYVLTEMNRQFVTTVHILL